MKEDKEITLRDIQDVQSEQLWMSGGNGPNPYSVYYQQDQRSYKDVEHALLHVMKAVGKIASVIEDADHSKSPEFTHEQVALFTADLVNCAIRIANTLPTGKFDLMDALIKRIEGKNNVSVTEALKKSDRK